MPIEREEFLKQFSQQALDERISLFMGAGGSCDAGYPTWSNLFSPFADALGVSIDDSTDFYKLAQYYSNNYGNIFESAPQRYFFRRKYELHRYHQSHTNRNNRPIYNGCFTGSFFLFLHIVFLLLSFLVKRKRRFNKKLKRRLSVNQLQLFHDTIITYLTCICKGFFKPTLCQFTANLSRYNSSI